MNILPATPVRIQGSFSCLSGTAHGGVAEFADELQGNPPDTLQSVAEQWAKKIWSEYTSTFTADIQRYRVLARIGK